MRKIIGVLLLISTTLIAQDKGQFESYSNNFYGKIVSESKRYDQKEKEGYKAFKMDFEGKKFQKVWKSLRL
jgi:hypothetical protein